MVIEKMGKKTGKTDIVLKVIGYVLIGLFLISSILFIGNLIKLNIIKTKYMVWASVLIIILTVIFILAQRKKMLGIITDVVSLLLIVVFIIGARYLSATHKAIDKISGVDTKEMHYSVYVLKEDSAQSVADTKEYTYGILEKREEAVINEYISELSEKYSFKINPKKYFDIQQLVDALKAGEIKAFVVNEAYLGILTALEGYESIEEELRIIDTKVVTEKIGEKETTDTEETKPDTSTEENATTDPYDEYKDYLYGGKDILTLYISGIDTNGIPTVNRNSDVNILMFINTNTRQIMTINTPRDFYVELPISNGQKDKLTHAGCYGVDVSVGTLEMLYGIKIDNYLKLNFDGFVGIIDSLGGVDVYSEYEFTVEPIKTYLVGMNHLTGIEALAFARERHSFGSGDRQRGKNQMEVIKALVNKAASSDMLLNYTDVLEAFSGCMVTDMTYNEITDLIKFQLSDMKGWNIISYSVDGSGDNLPCFSLSSPNYVMIPNMDTVNQAKEYIADFYAGKTVVIK